MLNKQIGSRIESLRQVNKLSQLELATKMGYKSDSTISKWENGTNIPSGGKLVKLAQILGTTTDYILFGGTSVINEVNHGVNGLDAGSGNTNTYNFGLNDNVDNHNESMKAISIADMKMSRALVNAQNETVKKLDRVIELLEEQNRILKEIKE